MWMQISTPHTHIHRYTRSSAQASEVNKNDARLHTSAKLMMVFAQFCIKRIINIIRGETATLSPTCDELSPPQNNKCQIKTAEKAGGMRKGHGRCDKCGMRKMHLNFVETFFSRETRFRLELLLLFISVGRERWTKLSPKNAIIAHGSWLMQIEWNNGKMRRMNLTRISN